MIEAKVAEVRKKLESDELKIKDTGTKKITETHALAEAKSRDAARMADALGIRGERMEGESFDRELQEQRKREKREAYEQKQIEREARERALEKDRKEAEKHKQMLRPQLHLVVFLLTSKKIFPAPRLRPHPTNSKCQQIKENF